MSDGARGVPFRALGGLFEADDVEAAASVIRAASRPGGDFFPLPEENDFQNAFAAHEGARRAVVMNSCGTALDVAMRALGIGPGDEVVTTPLTFVATAGCAAALGARVVFADIDERTLNLDPERVRAKLTRRTRAVIPVHFAGLACDIDAFAAISRETGVPVVYDAAHAVGTKHRGRPVGGFGAASCYSFQSNKNMTCLGEGGMLTTDDEALAEKARQLKTFGYVYGGPRLRIASIGFNYRMTKPQLAVGLTQLRKIDRVIAARLERFKTMQGLLAGVPELILPAGIEEGHGCHLYIVRLDSIRAGFDREALQACLKERFRVGTAVHYPILWSWEAFAGADFDATGCERAERAASQVLSLPIFPDTSPEDLEYVARALVESIGILRKER